MRTAFLFLAIALALLPSLRAADEIEFAVPDEGRITLGVFDGSGKLVRVLHKLAKEADFQVGLNGLITTWDGKNDAGDRVPPGHYYVRGYLVGDDVRVSGEDFLFNDWAADPGFPGFDRIEDFSLLENGDVVLLARAGSPPKNASDSASGISSGTGILPVRSTHLLARFSPDKGFLWSCKIEPTPGSLLFRQGDPQMASTAIKVLTPDPYLKFQPLLASNSVLAFVIAEEGTGIYALEDGKKTKEIPEGGGVAPLALTANGSKMFVSSSGGLAEVTLPDLSHEDITHPPSAFTAMDADATSLVGASQDGVWVRQTSFAKVPLPTTVTSVALGMPGTFWFVGAENGSAFVGQSSFSGEVLRALRPAQDEPKPEKIRASRTAEKFAVIESLPGLQRLRLMARAEGGEWTIEWERTLRDSLNFGFAKGKPAADAGGAAQEKSLRFRLKENPLTGKRDFLVLRAESGPAGSRLVSPDGLPLVEVSSRGDIVRTAIRRGDKPGSLSLLQGNGSFVEEFSVTGLDDILPLDAGGIDLP